MTVGVIAAKPLHLLEREPTSAISEAVLDRGYRRSFVDARPCVCGGLIEVFHDTDEARAYAVGIHNSSTAHERAMHCLGWR